MIENRTTGYERKKRRASLLTSDGPFPNNHNILQFYAGGGRGELLERLSKHLLSSEDPAVVTGEHGSGKTLLSLVLADRLKSKFAILRYDHATLSRDSLLGFLLSEIKRSIAPPTVVPADPLSLSEPSQGVSSGLSVSEQYVASAAGAQADLASLASLIENSRDINQPFLFLIDTPADLDADSLALIEELNSIRKNGLAYFSVVIFQLVPPDAKYRSASSSESMLHTHSENPAPTYPWRFDTYYLKRLSLSEIHDYLQHHMMLFDYSQRQMFTREMSYFIADRSEGVYGVINELARSAFLLAGINNSSEVSLSHLIAVSSPQSMRSSRSGRLRRSGVRFAFLVAGIVTLGAAIIVLIGS